MLQTRDLREFLRERTACPLSHGYNSKTLYSRPLGEGRAKLYLESYYKGAKMSVADGTTYELMECRNGRFVFSAIHPE